MFGDLIEGGRKLGRLLRISRRAAAQSALPGSLRGRPFDSSPIAGLGPRGEHAVSPRELELTDDEAERARAAGFKVALVLHTLESDWAKQQVDGITATLRDYGAEVVAVVDCEFDVARQIASLHDMIEVLYCQEVQLVQVAVLSRCSQVPQLNSVMITAE